MTMNGNYHVRGMDRSYDSQSFLVKALAATASQRSLVYFNRADLIFKESTLFICKLELQSVRDIFCLLVYSSDGCNEKS